MCSQYLAVDLGAESGRLSRARFDGERLAISEVVRFEHAPVRLPDGMHWNMLAIFQSIKDGLRRAVSAQRESFAGIGIDSWAVDFGLLDKDGALIGNPHTYRDGRTVGMIERAYQRVDGFHIYKTTGIQFNRINTLYQLLAMDGSEQLSIAHRLLMIPDLLNYWLSGEAVSERTNASTTQLYDVRRHEWAWDLTNGLALPAHILGPLVSAGTQIGTLSPDLADELDMDGETPILAVASHDTASAVVAVPMSEGQVGFISSGTWSLVGVERVEPVLTEEAMRAGFTNEEGFGGTTRFLKNVTGLWLLQECRRQWEVEAGRSLSYEELVDGAAAAPPAIAFIDPDDPEFLPPGQMYERICDFCLRSRQPPPMDRHECVRIILESLALKYRMTFDQMETVTAGTIGVIYLVGGGSRNRLLSQMTASATRRTVIAGPAEATAIGNAMVQCWARREVGSLSDIRAVVRRSFALDEYEPRDREIWEDRYGTFLDITARTTTAPVMA